MKSAPDRIKDFIMHIAQFVYNTYASFYITRIQYTPFLFTGFTLRVFFKKKAGSPPAMYLTFSTKKKC